MAVSRISANCGGQTFPHFCFSFHFGDRSSVLPLQQHNGVFKRYVFMQ